VRLQRGRELKGEPCLPDACGTRVREQAHVAIEQPTARPLDLDVPPDGSRRRDRERTLVARAATRHRRRRTGMTRGASPRLALRTSRCTRCVLPASRGNATPLPRVAARLLHVSWDERWQRALCPRNLSSGPAPAGSCSPRVGRARGVIEPASAGPETAEAPGAGAATAAAGRAD
jgi:hypothetical protein